MSKITKESTNTNQTKIGTGTASSIEFDEGTPPQHTKCGGHKEEFIHNIKREGYGLSTKTALGRLHDEIEKILNEYEQQWREER